MSSRLIVEEGKHGTHYHEAGTDEAWAEAALRILTERFEQGYWYHNPLETEGRYGPALEREEAAYLNCAYWLSREEVDALPEVASKAILQARLKDQVEYRAWYHELASYERIRRCVEAHDLSFVTNGRGTNRRPYAWTLLEDRSDHEYERVELVEAGSFS